MGLFTKEIETAPTRVSSSSVSETIGSILSQFTETITKLQNTLSSIKTAIAQNNEDIQSLQTENKNLNEQANQTESVINNLNKIIAG